MQSRVGSLSGNTAAQWHLLFTVNLDFSVKRLLISWKPALVHLHVSAPPIPSSVTLSIGGGATYSSAALLSQPLLWPKFPPVCSLISWWKSAFPREGGRLKRLVIGHINKVGLIIHWYVGSLCVCTCSGKAHRCDELIIYDNLTHSPELKYKIYCLLMQSVFLKKCSHCASTGRLRFRDDHSFRSVVAS